MIESWYGGPGMPAAAFSDTYVPAGWNTNTAIPGTTFTDTALYQNVVEPYCRTCHILRGTKNQDDLDFMKLGVPAAGVTPATGFLSYADRIKVHVFDRGNMPLAQIPHSDFWNSSAPQMLASFVDAQLGAGTATSNGAPLMPGRPIADPGPDRMVRTGSDAVLTGENSLFTNSFAWSQPTPSANVTITNPNNMVAMFNASVAGTYLVRLTVDGGAFKDVNITVDDNFPDPLKIKFAHVKNVLQNVVHATGQKCVGCHKDISTPQPATTPPIWYTNFDRNGSGGAADPTDDDWFVKELSGRVNLTEIQASPLLRKPSGNHHAGNKLFDLTTAAGLQSYSIVYNWILDGMPAGGVAANPGANTISPPLTLTFNGVFPGPFTANIPLDGSASVGLGTLSYLWTVASEPPGGSAVFPGSAFTSGAATTSLTIQQPGTYLAQLQVSDGPSTDVAQRTIVVNETPLAANLVVAGLSAGNVSVTFAGTPAAGSIGVTANQTAGNPVLCGWQVAPTVLNPSATGVSIGPSSCSGATLNVLPGAIGNQFTVTLTEQNLSLPPVVVSQTFTVQAAAGSNPSGASFSAISSTALGWSGTPAVAATRTFTSVTLQGSASGPGPLNFSWTATSGTAGCTIPAGASTSTTKSLTITGVGSCSVTMTVSNSILPNATSTQTVTITSSVQLSDVAAILGNPYPVGGPAPGAGCTNCHGGGGVNTPSWINNASLRGNLNLVTDGTQNSVLLLCPSIGNAACPGMPINQPGFGNGDFSNYNAFLTWILNGKP
jgi:hypothetical protein